MSLYKRKDSSFYWIKISVTAPDGRIYRIQESSGAADKVTAQEYHDRRAAELWREVRLKERPRMLWEEAVVKFLQETRHKRDHKGDKARLRWLHAYLSGKYLDEIDRDTIDRIKAGKQDRAAGTVNRYLATVRTILRKAEREWDALEKACHVSLLPEPKKRVRWITYDEAARLLKALPLHVRDAAEFSLATGVRQANCFGLTWSQVDMQRHTAWVYSDQVKGKRDLAIPLNAWAAEVIRRRIGTHNTHVFTYARRPMIRPDKETWRRACAKAGIKDFRWHDLRHTWASWHVMNGTRLHELQELGGWSSYEMVQRYAHLSSEHLKKVAGNVAGPVTNWLRSDLRSRDAIHA